jgi:pyruvate,orthophosphate dikinase
MSKKHSLNSNHAAPVPDGFLRGTADTPAQAEAALKAGAAGIGLCRTEAMLLGLDRLHLMRSIVLAQNEGSRSNEIAALLSLHRNDLISFFRTVSPLPVTIRLIDPPLKDFLPTMLQLDSEISDARSDENWEAYKSLADMRQQYSSFDQANPSMGHRGCRLGTTHPDILRMQVTAILQAALVITDEGIDCKPQIMVPLVASSDEMRALSALIHETAAIVLKRSSARIAYSVGALIELPRAAIRADAISEHSDFIAFGTHDLTQMTYGFSRENSRRYLDLYLKQGIFKQDPFVSLDQHGVGYLIKLGIENVRKLNPQMEIGICGEHSADPESLRFFRAIGADFVSCPTIALTLARQSLRATSLLVETSFRNVGVHRSMPVAKRSKVEI